MDAINVNFDATDASVVCVCECGWRTIRRDKAHAWYATARHLKEAHQCLNAAMEAARNARRIEQRKCKHARGRK